MIMVAHPNWAWHLTHHDFFPPAFLRIKLVFQSILSGIKVLTVFKRSAGIRNLSVKKLKIFSISRPGLGFYDNFASSSQKTF